VGALGRKDHGGSALNGETFLAKNRPNIFLTSFFRSGSTHIKETLLRLLPGYLSASTVLSAGEIGNDGYCQINVFAAQVLFPRGLTIFHQHTPGTSGNVAMLNRYEIRPVVQMRNMLDSIVSVRELLATGENQHIGIYYPKQFSKLSTESQLMWCVEFLPIWYFTFYLSWKYADIDKLFIWYDEYYKDQVKGMRRILDHVGLSSLGSVSDESISMASDVIDPGLSRFKFGRPGRGREILSGDMIDGIKRQAMAWPEGPELIEQLIERGI
jgi:hypothetical protein